MRARRKRSGGKATEVETRWGEVEAKRGQGGRDRYEVRARQIRGGGEAEAEARQRSGEAEVRRGRGQARQGGGGESLKS